MTNSLVALAALAAVRAVAPGEPLAPVNTMQPAPHAAPQFGPRWVPLQSVPPAQVQPQAATIAPTPPAMVTRYLPAGTLVSLTPVEEITSKHLKEGAQYQFIVVNDVTDGGVLVIPRGSKAVGVITMQTGRAVGGKSGKFDVTFQSVTANGITFALSGVHRQEGKGNTLGALFGSLVISGHSAVMLPGEVATAFTRQATPYSVPAAAVPVQAVPPVASAPMQAAQVAPAPLQSPAPVAVSNQPEPAQPQN